jgi:predicted transcriptional regulator
MVIEEGTSIFFAANTLGINYSTAKFIVKKYSEKGTLINRRNERKRRVQLTQNDN